MEILNLIKNILNCIAKLGILFIYISTDYVFDGTKPPYKIEDQPNDNNKNKRNESEESFNKRAMRMNSEERRAMI